MTASQSCFPVEEASAEAVVLTLSGLTAAVALKVRLLPTTAAFSCHQEHEKTTVCWEYA